MNRKLVFVFFIIFTSIFLILYSISTTAAPAPPTPSGNEAEKERIEEALVKAIGDQREYVLGYLVNDVQIASVQVSQDESWGVIFLEMIDPVTGELLPSEPGLAFALRSGSEWQIILPSDPGWIELVQSAPQELLTDEYKISYEEMYRTIIQTAQATYSGYLLPWDAGRTVYLSQSTGHDRYIPSESAHYSFDFYISKTMFQSRASKAGTVWRVRWDVPNGDDSDMGNYIVLKDESTSPTTYQLYLHLAQDSIPQELRTKGAYVAQGQYIGIADDTGQSTGHHLHFHVHTNPNSYWGTSVDITFQDVDINGGRPRRESDLEYCDWPGDVCNQYRNFYISGNIAPGDTQPPIGDLFVPETGMLINSNSVNIEGWAFDEHSGVNSSRLMAYFENEWHEIGDNMRGTTFSVNWDMCTDSIPDGPVGLALRIRDNAGNLSPGLPGLTHIIKNYNCNPDLIQCTPGANQIGIHSSSDFQGSCQVLEIGGYAQLSPEMESNIESIQIGTNVLAEVFGNNNFLGRFESIFKNDSNLDDNLLRGNQIKSIKVTPKTSPLLAPQILVYPHPGEQFPSGSSISFSWRYSGPGNEFQVQVDGPSGESNSQWLPSPYWIGENHQFTAGVYTWKVRTRRCPDATCNSPWSETQTFEITATPPSMLSTSAPFMDTLESGSGNWSFTGLWNMLSEPERSHSLDHSWYYGLIPDHNYDSIIPNSGDLTSKPIIIPDSNFVLRFWYRYDTEEDGANWDQRWVQISSNGSPFENILQLKDDEEDQWLQATLDLAQYAGEEVQIRFHFATLDSIDNADGEGWLIDDIEILQYSIPACIDGNDSPSSAEIIKFDQTLLRGICPTGDIDYYKFDGLAGDHIVLDIDTQSSGTIDNLDLYLLLLDSDGRSVLAQHDDEILGIELDPHLGYQLNRSGTYYIRTRLWSHPSHGGEDFNYEISLTKDNNPPQGSFIHPESKSYLQESEYYNLSVNASDFESGISYVQFMYHPGDWLASSWQVIGTDQNGIDGWGITIDANDYPEQKDAAFFANIFDWAGNWIGTGVWEIGLDHTPPVTVLNGLSPVQQSTAIQLQWSGTDNLAGIDFFQVQSKIAGGDWANFLPNPTGSQNYIWFVGQPGQEYSFRMRGIDHAGNLETFPETPESITFIPDAGTICSAPDTWDSSGNDNSPEDSITIDLLSPPKLHNFCNPLTADRLYDEDWVDFEAENGHAYLIESYPLAAMTGTILELYSSDGNTLILSTQSETPNGKSRIIWTSDRSGIVYLRVRHSDGAVAGNIVAYQLKVNKFLPSFMPFIHK